MTMLHTLRKIIQDEALLQYNGMLIDVTQLITDARARILSNVAGINARRDAWIAHTDFKHALIGGGSVGALAEVWNELQRAAGGMGRISELLQEQPAIAAPAHPLALPVPLRGEIRFEQVSFHYPQRDDAPALHGFDLHVCDVTAAYFPLLGCFGSCRFDVFGAAGGKSCQGDQCREEEFFHVLSVVLVKNIALKGKGRKKSLLLSSHIQN